MWVGLLLFLEQQASFESTSWPSSIPFLFHCSFVDRATQWSQARINLSVLTVPMPAPNSACYLHASLHCKSETQISLSSNQLNTVGFHLSQQPWIIYACLWVIHLLLSWYFGIISCLSMRVCAQAYIQCAYVNVFAVWVDRERKEKSSASCRIRKDCTGMLIGMTGRPHR